MALKGLMARAERMVEEHGENTPAASTPARRTVGPATCVDASTELDGKLRCKDTIRVDGRVKGEIHSEQSVILGESARVHANIHADAVLIAGEVKGDIVATRKITLERTARVTGNLATPGIVIEEGAKLEGRITIGADEQQPAAQKEAAPRKESAARGAARKAEPAPNGQPAPEAVPAAQ